MVDDVPTGSRAANALRLAELLTARLCHDLSGALGTVVGALEMAQEDPATAAEALPLAGDAARQLAARLRLLRAAWSEGMGGMQAADLLGLLQGGVHGRKLRIDADQLTDDVTFSPNGARLLLNVLMVAVESLPRGGQVSLAGSPAAKLIVTIEGQGAAWPTGFAGYLTQEAAAWEAITDARRLQAPLTALIAWASALKLTMLMPTGPHPEAPAPLLLDLTTPS